LEDEVRIHDREDVQESLTSDELLRKLAAAKLKELTGDQSGSDSDLEEIDEVLEAEREALVALLEGDAVDEHMEDVYFMRLKNMLDARNIY
jgi:predicted negative regulator of RcsB-dependent stress response